MSVCTFIASDLPLAEFSPAQDYPLEIKIDNGAATINDGGADDNYFIHIFDDVENYTRKKYGVWLEWDYTDGRATQILEYIKNALNNTDSIELWRVWLMYCYDYEESPIVQKKTVSIKEFSINHIREINSAEIWNKPDKNIPSRPSFYCLTIKK